ncbi:hypothetical protein BASA81_000961 [Batrachochytrium salamandrivorans]|nr:hypothetical protein BASA81_000961 [Batrachochytrium salamandrivorans]
MQEESNLVTKMHQAITSGNVQEIKRYMDEMISFGMGHHPTVAEGLKITKEQSQAIAKFQQIVDKLRLQAIDAERDIKKLQVVQQSVLELGIAPGVSKEIDQALALLQELDKENMQHRLLQNARKALRVKATRTNGLSGEEDLQDLRLALKQAQLPKEDDEMKETIDCLERGEQQLKVQTVLLGLIESKDLDKLRGGLEQCQGLEMNTVDVYIKLRERILQLEDQHKPKPTTTTLGGGEASLPIKQRSVDLALDEGALEKKNKEKLRNANSPGFYFGNYFRLRSDADFAKGIMFNKNKPITAKLSYQSDSIHKSLCELSSELSRSATRLNKNILGYCGDVMMSFPASLAQDLVDKCLNNPALVDEVYLQLCKHASLNPEPQSLGRVWQLFCICVGCFPPSIDFEPFLLNFFLKSYQTGGIVGQYARYALRRLQSTVSFGPSATSISIDEIVAYGDRPPVMATIQLIDGTHITKDFPVPPHMNVDDVLRICSEFLGLGEEHSEWFGMFVKESPIKKRPTSKQENVDAFFSPQSAQAVQAMPDGMESHLPPPPPPMDDEDEDDIPPRTQYPLESTQYMGDVVLAMVRSQMSETFVFKRKFFLPTKLDLGAEPVYNRLMYLQVLDEVLGGSWHCPKIEQVVELAAIAFAVDLGEDMPQTVEGVLDEGLLEYLPEQWKEKKSETEWAKLVLSKRDVLLQSGAEELELLFMQTAQQLLPTFGSCSFYVRREWGGSDFVAFVDYSGLRVMTVRTRELVSDTKYNQVRRITASSRVLTLDLGSGNDNLMLFTSQAKEIAGLMQDYRNLLSLIPSDEPAPLPKKKFFVAPGGGGDGKLRHPSGLFASPMTNSPRDRILSVTVMKPSASNSTLEAAKKMIY